MYDADEQIHDIKSTVSQTAHVVKTGYDIIKKLRGLKKEKIAQMAVNSPDFVFTGQVTDLRFFLNHDVMSMDMITDIADPQLRAAVQSEFNFAAKNGLIVIDPQNRTVVPTEKGMEFIKQPNFMEAARQHLQEKQLTAKAEATQNLGFPLTGGQTDLLFFNHADTLNLTAVMKSPNQELAQSILEGFQKLQAAGKVSINGLNVTLTPLGKEALASPFMQAASASVKPVATGEPISTAIIVALQTAAKVVNNINKK